MKLVRREFLQLAGAVITISEASHSAAAQELTGAPSPTELLRSDLVGQDYKVTETLVTMVAFPPGAVSSWHVHRGAQELVFGLEGKLTLEIEGRGTKSIGAGETGLVPSDVRASFPVTCPTRCAMKQPASQQKFSSCTAAATRTSQSGSTCRRYDGPYARHSHAK